MGTVMNGTRLNLLLKGHVRLEYRKVTGSTSDDAKTLVSSGVAVPIAVVATEQTKGRGRRGNSFSSPPGGIYLTLAVSAAPITRGMELITSAIALRICEVLEETYAVEPGIKWVNDVYLEGRKLCGILVERVCGADEAGVVLIGVGLNCLARPDFEGGVRPISLAEVVPEESIDSETLCARLIRTLLDLTGTDIFAAEVVEGCARRSTLIGKRVLLTHDGARLEGTAIALDERGRLIVDLGDACLTLDSAASNVRLA